MGGNTSNKKPGSPSDWGGWGQVDPLRSGDAATFDRVAARIGRDEIGETEYNSLTPEQQQQWRGLADENAKGEWMKRAFPGGAVRSPDAAGGTAQSDYERAATVGSSNSWGSQSYDPATNQWNQKLSGAMGGANSSLEQMYADMLSQPFDDGTSAREQATDAAYKQATSRLDPQWAKREEAQRTQLLNQGLDPTSEAGKNAMSDMGMQRNDAYSSAMNSAIGQGREAGESVFRQNQAARMAPMQHMQMLKALSQAGAPPQLLNALIAQKNNELGLAGQAQQAQADMMNAGVGLMGALAKFGG
jgi:hypothetical protein